MNEEAGSVLTPVPYPYPEPKAKKAPFQAELKDGVFALAAFVLGYLFCRWVLSATQGWGTASFTVLYLGAVLFYLLKKGVRPETPSWFWFGVTLLTGVSFALWGDSGVTPLRGLFLFCCAVYWVTSVSGVLPDGKTGDSLPLDGINAVFVLPLRNFANQYRGLGAFRIKREGGRKKALSAVLGVLLSLAVLFAIVPQLLRADSGSFSRLVDAVTGVFTFDLTSFTEFLFFALLAVPTAAYLYGLVSGCAVKRGTDAFTREKTDKLAGSLRILPPGTTFAALGSAVGLYVLFIACQIPYFFSAFSGVVPDGFLSYADYARRGFFELCRLSAVNLLLILAANIFSRKPRRESPVLRGFNIALTVVSLVLIATAFSKMALYIGAYGLTIPRVLPCVFMVFLTAVFIAVLALQKWAFSIARVALVTGAVLMGALCLINTDALVVRYNTGRYLAGTLSQYDTEVLRRAGTAGVASAAEVYQKAADPAVKSSVGAYLEDQSGFIRFNRATYRDTLENERAWNAVKDLNLPAAEP